MIYQTLHAKKQVHGLNTNFHNAFYKGFCTCRILVTFCYSKGLLFQIKLKVCYSES